MIRHGIWKVGSGSSIRSILNSSYSHLRGYSTKEYTSGEIEKARQWLEKFSGEQVPQSVFDISYSRSSGAGGQKVNKTSSKATVALEPHQWLNPQFCYWIPEPVRDQLKERKVRYETKSGGILIQSDLTRNRDTNTDECFRKLIEEIKAKTHFAGEISDDDKKKWEEIKEETKEKRLFHKKKQADKKKLRSKKIDW